MTDSHTPNDPRRPVGMAALLLPAHWGRFCIRITIYVFVMLGFLYFIQDGILYAPTRLSLADTERYAARDGLTLWPGPADYRGLLRQAETPLTRGTFLVFHGNAGGAVDRSYFARALARRGFRVLLLEYPGYGARTGDLGEKSLVADALRSMEMARHKFDGPLFLAGESLGAGVAAAAAAASAVPIAGLLAITPWANLPDLAQSIVWYLPARWLVRDRFDNIANLDRYGGRVAVCIAGSDEIIAPHHGLRLYDALTTSRRKWVFEGRGHNNWPAEPDAEWWTEVTDFLAGP